MRGQGDVEFIEEMGRATHPDIPDFIDLWTRERGQGLSRGLPQALLLGEHLGQEPRPQARRAETQTTQDLAAPLEAPIDPHDRPPPLIHQDILPDRIIRHAWGRGRLGAFMEGFRVESPAVVFDEAN